MEPTNVVAIFDVGKTNKKLFLFDEHYKIVYEKSARFTETVDEEGDSCENLESLRLSVFDSLREVFKKPEFCIKAINFSTFGASFVYIDSDGKPVAPLYNYLKVYSEELKKQFYDTYNGEAQFSKETASPVLGNLNSGMQLYRIKYQKPELFKQIKYALHLPQYLSYLITGKPYSDITSIGCHTNLWNFTTNQYHQWVKQEGVLDKLAPIIASDSTVPASLIDNNYHVGVGLHDSSAALIPYLVNFKEPFILISTGTWCISFNPFNQHPLTYDELEKDCLSYMQYQGKPVKASRIFAGFEHEEQTKRIALHFHQNTVKYRTMEFMPDVVIQLLAKNPNQKLNDKSNPQKSNFASRKLSCFKNDTEAYHQLIIDLVALQLNSTNLVLKNTLVKRIFVDGGFSKNSIYMNLLASYYPDMGIYAASMAQATAVGTAMAIHKYWNTKNLPKDIIELKFFALDEGLVS